MATSNGTSANDTFIATEFDDTVSMHRSAAARLGRIKHTREQE